MNKEQTTPEIITMKTSNGHLIKIIKGVKEGWKYIGIYQKVQENEE